MEPFGLLLFQCNICGSACRYPAAALSREEPSCVQCGSTVRMRAMMHALSCALFGYGMPLTDFPVDRSIAGIGMSDWVGYATPLAEKFAYRNTYYHQPPRLDITRIADGDAGSADFIISSDVFEHVAPPVSIAFDNALRMLKPEGVMVFSVPYATAGSTIEHFPELHDFRIEQRPGGRALVNRTVSGAIQEFGGLVFHGGGGDTLEMRQFSETGLLREFERAGFNDVEVLSAPCFEFGVWHRNGAEVPILARRERPCVNVRDFGPRLLKRRLAGETPESRESIWITVQADARFAPAELRIGRDSATSMQAGPGVVTGHIPESVLARAGAYPVTLRVRNSRRPVCVGTLIVVD